MKKIKRMTALVLCLVLCLSLCGCRYSDVLEQIIYDLHQNQEINPEQDFFPADNDAENEDTSDDLSPLREEEAERTRDQVDSLSTGREDNSNVGAQLDYAENSTNDQTARQDSVMVPDTSEEREGESGSAGIAPEEPEDEEPTDSGSTTDSADENDGGQKSSGTGNQGYDYGGDSQKDTNKQTVDPYGDEVELPDSAASIAAVGSVAIMVMMLGGEEALCATNSDLAANSLVTTVFPSVASVPALWSGSGTQALSDSAFKQLLELHPDLVVETTGDTTFTDDQVAQLQKSGIAYQVLPRATTLANVQTIMTTLAGIMEEYYEGAEKIAREYVTWTDSIYSSVSSKTSLLLDSLTEENDDQMMMDDGDNDTASYYTLYIDGWDDSAYYKLSNDNYVVLEGYGCAYFGAYGNNTCKAVSAFLDYAGVYNTAQQYVEKTYQYITPLVSQGYGSWTITGSAATSVCLKRLLEYGTGLGNDRFTVLITADNAAKEAIEASRDATTTTVNGFSGIWSVYPRINNAAGQFNSDGFLDPKGNLVATQVSGDYEVVANPYGLTSWASGGPESILESVWAAWRITGALTESEVRAAVKEFYEKFYSFTLSDAQINKILEGQ